MLKLMKEARVAINVKKLFFRPKNIARNRGLFQNDCKRVNLSSRHNNPK